MAEPREFNYDAHDPWASVFSSAVNMTFTDKLDIVTGTNSYSIAERAFYNTNATGKHISPGVSAGHMGIFAVDKAAADVLRGTTNAYTVTLDVTFKNTSHTEIEPYQVVSKFTTASAKGFNPACITPPIVVPDSFTITHFLATITLTAALATALNGEDLYVGWVPK